eukprot:1196168-Prorocentrum_minimum.AAC.6
MAPPPIIRRTVPRVVEDCTCPAENCTRTRTVRGLYVSSRELYVSRTVRVQQRTVRGLYVSSRELYVSRTVRVQDCTCRGLYVSRTVRVEDCTCRGLYVSVSHSGPDRALRSRVSLQALRSDMSRFATCIAKSRGVIFFSKYSLRPGRLPVTARIAAPL